MEPIRILHVVPNMQAGGLETFIMNVYRNIDREKIQFDFLVHYSKHCFYDDEIEQLGGRIYRMTVREDKNFIRYIIQLNQFFEKHREYTIVHGHMTSFGIFYFFVAKNHGVNVRICHSHTSSADRSPKGFMKRILEKLSKTYANVRFACSESAGKYMFGKDDFVVIPNAVNIARFRFNDEIRKQIREQLHLSEKLVVGHVGRFDVEKNHSFILAVFHEIKRINPDSMLILIGTGKLFLSIQNEANELGLQDSVLFLGARTDVNVLYQAMDILILPSFYEGLPIVTVEAQCAGLAVFASDAVSKEARITDNLYFIPLKCGAKYWSDQILKTAKNYKRKDMTSEIQKSGFEIKSVSDKLTDFYLSRTVH